MRPTIEQLQEKYGTAPKRPKGAPVEPERRRKRGTVPKPVESDTAWWPSPEAAGRELERTANAIREAIRRKAWCVGHRVAYSPHRTRAAWTASLVAPRVA